MATKDRLKQNSLDTEDLQMRRVPEKPDGDLPGRPALLVKRPSLKAVAKAAQRSKNKSIRYNQKRRRNPYKPLVPERYTEYCDHIGNEQGISRHRALIALLDLGIAAYEAMIPPAPSPSPVTQGTKTKP